MNAIQCKACGYSNKADSRFCSECGLALPRLTSQSTILELCQIRLNRVTRYLGIDPGSDQSIQQGLDVCLNLDKANTSHGRISGWEDVEKRLQISKDLRSRFVSALKTLRDKLSVDGSNSAATKAVEIASLRLIVLLNEFSEANQQLEFADDLSGPYENVDPDVAARMRAIELSIREVIRETHGSEQQLLARLRDLFGKQIDEWMKRATKGDILSGTTLSDVGTIFLNEEEFSHKYKKFFENDDFIQYVNDQRLTIRLYLDDLRRIRNKLAHHKPVTVADAKLLFSYFDQLLTPFRLAHKLGMLRFSPEVFDHPSPKDVDVYLASIGNQLTNIDSGVADIRIKSDKTFFEVVGIKRRFAWLAIGVVIVAIVLAALLKVATGLKLETSANSREQLANLGIAWSQHNLGAAIGRNDLITANLFLKGGMHWDLSYASGPLNKDRIPMLKLLAKYQKQADGTGYCAVLIFQRETGAFDSSNATRQYVGDFCGSPADLAFAKRVRSVMESFNQAMTVGYEENFLRSRVACTSFSSRVKIGDIGFPELGDLVTSYLDHTRYAKVASLVGGTRVELEGNNAIKSSAPSEFSRIGDNIFSEFKSSLMTICRHVSQLPSPQKPFSMARTQATSQPVGMAELILASNYVDKQFYRQNGYYPAFNMELNFPADLVFPGGYHVQFGTPAGGFTVSGGGFVMPIVTLDGKSYMCIGDTNRTSRDDFLSAICRGTSENQLPANSL